MTKLQQTFGDLLHRPGGAFFTMKAGSDPTKVVMCFVGQAVYLGNTTGRRHAGIFDEEYDRFTLRIRAVDIPHTEPVWEIVGVRWPFEAVECRLPDDTIVSVRLPWHPIHEG